MQHDIEKYLMDILLHIDYIDTFLEGKRDFRQYQQDLATQYAVERALGIIGEAANNIRKLEPNIPISHMRQIIAMRNLLVHAYDSVNSAIIWGILANHLPLLKKEVALLLKIR